jgi:hypothetical protein
MSFRTAHHLFSFWHHRLVFNARAVSGIKPEIRSPADIRSWGHSERRELLDLIQKASRA